MYNLKKDYSKNTVNSEKIEQELKELKAKVARDEKEQKKKSRKEEKKDFKKNLVDNSKVGEVKCDMCDYKFSSMKPLKMHARVHHMRQSQTQTVDIGHEDKSSQSKESVIGHDKIIQTCEENLNGQSISDKLFSEYECYYCGYKIESKEHLKDHRMKCLERFAQFIFSKNVP